MTNNSFNTRTINTTKWFWLFAGVHLFFWTLLPALIRYNLPMDAIEGAAWGHQLALGYDKNPWMNAWLTELAIKLGGQSGWMTYLFGQISVVLCFWAVWQLAKKIVAPVYALIAVFLLELISSFNLDAIDFNDNVLELSLWALMILCFYNALQKQKIYQWALVGVFAGLAMMTKYYVVVLFLPMGLFLLSSKEARISFFKPGLYVAAIMFLLISVPHFIWLFFHDFITVKYAFTRVAAASSWTNHFLHAYHFLIPIVTSCILPVLVFATLYIGRKDANVIARPETISGYSWYFLLCMGLGPLIVTLLYSMVSGALLHTGWRTPLFSLFGLLLVAWLQPVITRARFYRLVTIIFLLLATALIVYAVTLIKAGSKSDANYPGKIIAARLTQQWHIRYHTKLAYVVGTRLEAATVALYSKDRPAVYIDANPKISFWVDEEELRRKGALFVWDPQEGDSVVGMFARFHNLQYKHVAEFNWLRDQQAPPVKLHIAFLPPFSK